MKLHLGVVPLGVLGFLLAAPTFGRAAVFTADTRIAFNDTNYDGEQIVVTNCVLTIDGPHTFSSFGLQQGAVLTHSYAPSGFSQPIHVTNEQQVLTGTDSVQLTNGGSVILTSVVVSVRGTIYTNNVDYTAANYPGITLLQRTTNSAIADGATVSVDYDYNITIPAGLKLSVTGDFLVAIGAAVRADGLGYTWLLSPGRGYSSTTPNAAGTGAGHGGFGGLCASNAAAGIIYDQLAQPDQMGSTGGDGANGPGGSGGGLISIVAGGVVRIDGTLSANGLNATNARAGGGSGGGIFLAGSTLLGSGSVSANGGSGEPSLGGGGSGGRIAFQCETNLFAGTVSAFGGRGFQYGGAGTIFIQSASQTNGVITVDNAGHPGASTDISVTGDPDLVVTGSGIVSVSTSLTVGNLTVGTNSWISPGSGSIPTPGPGSFALTVLGDATVQAGGGCNLDGTGSPYNFGSGPGRFFSSGTQIGGGGGGHAGYGGDGLPPYPGTSDYIIYAQGGNYYGSLNQPIALGSGGGGSTTYPGGSGGGALRLIVNGLLTLDGTVSVKGTGPSIAGGGGGSGGSIWINVGTLAGSGLISANGGSALGPSGGGGSGGRIAVYSGTNLFAGNVDATGGAGLKPGAAGSVFLQTGSSVAQVVVDNAGLDATNTFLGPIAATIVDVSVLNGARAATSLSISNLYIGPGGTFIPFPVGSGGTLIIQGNATIAAGGALSVAGLGSRAGSGQGAGRYISQPAGPSGSGAGAAGYGGSGAAGTYTPGGNAYGSVYNPTSPGSGGGASSSSTYYGGAGGGALRLTVLGLLAVDGQISADAQPALVNGGGGGSGGSLWITTTGLRGSGLISANGGAGNLPNGGGGSGGRIAIYYTTNLFTGALMARGGIGFVGGAAGTILLHANDQNSGQILVDNGGLIGTNTLLTGIAADDLSIVGGAGARFSSSQIVLKNVLVGSNSWLSTSLDRETWRCTTAIIQAGGRMTADAQGRQAYNGNGRYGSVSGGGGGHSGFGGSGSPSYDYSANGGIAFMDAVDSPSPGGRGGVSYASSAGVDGYGGGALSLFVTGLLTVDGRLSANGNDSNYNGSGGGAGGGLKVSVGGLAGSGVISARGGHGNLPNGGGGGGGYIVMSSSSNRFAGTITARGGEGYMSGGAGAIYMSGNPQFPGQWIVDNEGVRGTNSLLPATYGIADLLVRRGVALNLIGYANLNNLVLEPNSTLWLTSGVLTVNNNAIVPAGAAILADGTGWAPGSGPGAGVTPPGGPGGGASHGGLGGVRCNPVYGSFQSPILLGSGGSTASGVVASPLGGRGGGAINLNIRGSLLLDGIVSANGLPGGLKSGGGSGGSVLLVATTLLGSGFVSACGGAGNGTAGGGGGGRIALYTKTNQFAGTLSAFGGAGGEPGGAGTIFSGRGSMDGRLLIDNGGLSGTNTPLIASATFPVDLTVVGAASVRPSASYLILSNLAIETGSSLTIAQGSASLDLAVLRDLTIAPGSAISVDAKGYSVGAGPGAGLTSFSFGSGAGHGGVGGASATVVGGPAYDSETGPVERGSGGGFGLSTALTGSEGGGTVRLTVGGSLVLNGAISANGNSGVVDSSGGGSGGSIWITAGHLAGTGQVIAKGGDGEFFGGGGGAGGCILLQLRTNDFSGSVIAPGGLGFEDGSRGTVNVTAIPDLQVVSHDPAGVVSNSVSSLTLTFNAAVDPLSFPSVQLLTPGGRPVNPSTIFVGTIKTTVYSVKFPEQSTVGDYTVLVSPPGQALAGMPFSQVYTGSFSILLPQIRGRVTDISGQPVPDVYIQPSGAFSAAVTDTNGDFRLGAPPGITFSVTPSYPGLFFLPGSRSYTNVTEDISGQDYTMVTSVMGPLTSTQQDTNLVLRCSTVPGVQYKLSWSTNLLDWFAGSNWLPGTNGVLEVVLPIDIDPAKFFRLEAQY